MRGFVVFIFGCLTILLAFGYIMVTGEINSFIIMIGILGAVIAGFNYHSFLTIMVAYFNSKSRG